MPWGEQLLAGLYLDHMVVSQFLCSSLDYMKLMWRLFCFGDLHIKISDGISDRIIYR